MRLPDDVQEQLDKVLQDPLKFIKLLKIQDKYSGKLVRFSPNGEQVELIKKLQQHQKIIILKPRQIGISTLLRAYALWQTYITKDPLKFGVISFHQRSAKNLRRMDKLMHDSLPMVLHRKLAIDNATTMSFEDSGSELSSFTAGSKGGTRSFMLSSVHLSEFAFYDDPQEMLAQIVATVGTGQILIESTPNQPADSFHRLIMGAPENGWQLITYWWWEHHHYKQEAPKDFEPSEEESWLIKQYNLDNDQLYWRRNQIATVGLEKFRREYPGCLDDAFHYASASYFGLDDIRDIEEIHFDGEERLYEEPRDDDVYAMGVDVAAGVGRDYSAISVISMATFQPVFHYRSNTISPSAFADKVMQIGNLFNNARVLCESNNHGHVVLYRLRHFGYKHLWCSVDGKDWTTTTKSKLDAYETLREYITQGMIMKMDAQVLAELRCLVVLRVTPEAPPGMHDDLAMSIALAYRCLRDIPRRKLKLVRRNLMDVLISQTRAKKTKEQPIPWKKNV
tara:strand:- start:3568 stop:5088 length:1521 start_codon:yes stop_codon:yes gene_type:complete